MQIPLRVLLLEDNPADAKLVLHELKRSGYAVESMRVETEAEYLERLTDDTDLIVADYSMPQFDAPRALSLLNERGLDVPFLVVTGTVSEEVVVDCMKRGAADYLLKDRLARLGPAVAAALASRRSRSEQRAAEIALRRRDLVLSAVSYAAERFLATGDWEESIGSVLERIGVAADVSRVFIYKHHPGADGAILCSLHSEWTAPWSEPRIGDPRLQDFPLKERGFGRWIDAWLRGEVIAGNVRELPDGERDSIVVPMRSFLAAPIFAGDEFWGTIGLSEDRTERDWPSPEVEALRTAAGILGAVVQRKRLEDALGTERWFLQVVLDTIDVGVVACDPDGILTVFNRTARDFYGASASSLPPERWAEGYDLFLPDGKTRMAPEQVPLYRALRGEHVRDEEMKIAPRDGHARVILASGEPIVGADGDRLGAVVAMQDVTERKLLEEQLRQSQKMEAVGRLAGGVAHDFNNLLTVIQGYSDLALKRLAPEDPIVASIEEVRAASMRAAGLTQQLLAFSRKQVLQPKIVNLNAIVTNLNRMLVRLIGEDVEVEALLDREIGLVKADPGQIEQVVFNLVVNARDAMPEGGLLTIETANVGLTERYADWHAGVGPGPYVMLAVTDTGCGMDAETQSHIFEPFFTTKEAGKGTGLGLATVYGIVKQSGGSIWVYSERGRGTTFKVYLPRVEEPAEPARPEAAGAMASGRGETVLVVEDDGSVRALIRETLRLEGYRVLDAGDGQTALEMVDGHVGPIHLLITDVVMPKVSGRDLMRQFVERRPESKVLVMSGYTDNVIGRHDLLDTGAVFLEKPFGPDALASKVRHLLDGHSDED